MFSGFYRARPIPDGRKMGPAVDGSGATWPRWPRSSISPPCSATGSCRTRPSIATGADPVMLDLLQLARSRKRWSTGPWCSTCTPRWVGGGIQRVTTMLNVGPSLALWWIAGVRLLSPATTRSGRGRVHAGARTSAAARQGRVPTFREIFGLVPTYLRRSYHPEPGVLDPKRRSNIWPGHRRPALLRLARRSTRQPEVTTSPSTGTGRPGRRRQRRARAPFRSARNSWRSPDTGGSGRRTR